MEIVIRCAIAAAKPYVRVTKKIIQQANQAVRHSRTATVSVNFIGDQKMRALNRKYRGHDKTTNVLAFPIHLAEDLGDIFIDFLQARREARQYGWTINYALARLALHGFLHLLNYDHQKEKDAQKMEKIEQKILARI